MTSITRLAAVLLLTTITVAGARASRTGAQQPVRSKMTGTTPCGDDVRAFVGGLAVTAPCHAITWDLELVEIPAGKSSWSLTATYSIPRPENINALTDGPRVRRSGVLEVTQSSWRNAAVLRMRAPDSNAVLSLGRISPGLMHFLDANDKLVVGTAGWNYLLSAAELAEPPPASSVASGMSYTIAPRASGDHVFAVFEGRTPCTRIASALGIAASPGCLKVKWRVTLYQNAVSKAPTTFKTEGSLYRDTPDTGTWRTSRGTPTDPAAVVYELRSSARRPMLLMKGSEDVLFLLDDQRMPLVGNRDFSYALNRVVSVQ